MKNSYKNNPIQYKDSRVNTLEDAYGIFIEVLEEYIENNPTSNEPFDELKLLIKEAYLDKKLEYFLDSKLEHLNEKIDTLANLTLSIPNSKTNYTNLFYLKHTNLITNE